jgi:lipopolysaccharide/colanic/teichoic acid biosynthesis glycosyltransferase
MVPEDTIRRVRDVLGCLVLLLATLPLLLTVACLIRLDSPGPALFRQRRVGQHGRVFTMLKFRSMRTDAEANGPVWAVEHDPRATRVGGFIRRTRIDELPQLINVLRGEMSLVGPRPERPEFEARLSRAIPNYRERCLVPPGITGLAQVTLPYSASVDDARRKQKYDLFYVRNRSLALDLRIMLATASVMLRGSGAR